MVNIGAVVSGAPQRPVQTKLGETISVGDFGAVPDNKTDSTSAFAAAFSYAAANPGTRIEVPCSSAGKYYLITAPLTLPSYTTIEGSNGTLCNISYNPTTSPGTVAAVLNGIGAQFVSIRHLRVVASSSNYPPNSVLMLGRLHSTDAAGGHQFEDVTFTGYVNGALVYSIASEVDTWDNDAFVLQGGNAVAAFYTSSQDYLGICAPACGTSSNLSLFMSHFRAVLHGGNPAAAIMDNLGGGAGDHVYRDGYMSGGTAGDGFEFVSSGGSGPNTPVQVSSVRFENGKYAVHFVKGINTYLSVIDVRNLTEGNTSSVLMYGDTGLTLQACRFEQNSSGTNASSSLDILEDSHVEEHYGTITIRTSAHLNVLMAQGVPGGAKAGFLLPSGDEDENLIIGLQGSASAFRPPATLMLRPGGIGAGYAWGPSLNLPDGSGHCTAQIGDICSVAHQPEYYDGTAARKVLLGGVAQFSDLGGALSLSQMPAALTQIDQRLANGGVGLTTVAQPACDVSHEGTIYYTTGKPGLWRVCTRDTSGNYDLHSLSIGQE
jgi:hypothetical protein